MSCGLPPNVKVRLTVIARQSTSITVPPSRVATNRDLPRGSMMMWCDVAGRANDPRVFFLGVLIFNKLFTFVVTRRVRASGDSAGANRAPTGGVTSIFLL